MAPFKLFRLGQGSTSRSTSQETEPDQPANLVITTTSLHKLTNVMKSPSAHYLNVDESDQTSENSSLMSLNNDQRALLSSGSTADQIGYSSPQLSDIPISPPPSYEAVMKENQLLALDKENNTIQTTIHTNILVDSFYNTTSHGSNNNLLNDMNEFTTNNVQSLTSPVRENLLIDDGSECTDECNQNSCNCINNEGGNNNEDYGDYDERCLENDLAEQCNLENCENNSENDNNYSEDSNECQNQYHDNNYSNQYDDGGGQQQMNYVETKGPEILHKSSKELYKAVAKQCGIQCKMTDTCRCVECQSRYFDCEFDQNDNESGRRDGDGGLGAGTPMYLNEVLHGTACVIL